MYDKQNKYETVLDFELRKWVREAANEINRESFVDRGDPTDWDYEVGDFTTDGDPHELDLSAIVPIGAKAVLLAVQITDDATGSYVLFKKNGNTNDFNGSFLRTQTVNIINENDMIVFCDTDRKVVYKASNVAFLKLSVAVRGWWMK